MLVAHELAGIAAGGGGLDLSVLDREIRRRIVVLKYMRFFRGFAELLDSDRIEVIQEGCARLTHGGLNHLLHQQRVRIDCF